MRSPFPGMDPYLENPVLWSSFHSRLIVAIANAIEVTLPAQYYVEVETRTYQDDGTEGVLVGIPDVSIIANPPPADSIEQSNVSTQIRPKQVTLPMPVTVKERYLEIREVTSHQVVTALELLSPKNKKAGEGRDRYLRKRLDILGSKSHLVELDLLRVGQPMPISDNQAWGCYRILISRSSQRPSAALYSLELWQSLPDLPIPLKADQEVVILPLQTVFDEVYVQARYASRIDYTQPIPLPTLSPEEQAWVQSCLNSRAKP